MQVTVSNLIRRKDNTFKSNSTLCASFEQDFNLLSIKSDSAQCQDQIMCRNSSLQNTDRLKKTLKQNLNELNSIYLSFYQIKDSDGYKDKDKSKSETDCQRLNLLFRDTSFGFKEENSLKIMAQIIRIYDLVIRIKCKICKLLVSSCDCSNKRIQK